MEERLRHRVQPAALAHVNKLTGVRPAPELSIVVPTFNERDNITELVRAPGGV